MKQKIDKAFDKINKLVFSIVDQPNTSSDRLKFKKNPITDDYKILSKVLGLGISGKVRQVVSKKDAGDKCALKILNDTTKSRKEIELHWNASSCKHIVNIKDVYENEFNGQTKLLVVMECIEDGDLLNQILQKRKFNETEAAELMKDICNAVKFLHDSNIAHRDLKPENLLYSKKGVLKLTDFGFAKETHHTLQTPCYTPYYVAPEVFGPKSYDKSCDIWSLGVIMYILLCGYPPFNSNNGQPISAGMKRRIKCGQYEFPDKEWTNVSNDAKDLIRGMLNTDPSKRFNIDQVINNKWISQFNEGPKTSLVTPQQQSKEETTDQCPEMAFVMNENQVDLNPMPSMVKPLTISSKLAKKRKRHQSLSGII